MSNDSRGKAPNVTPEEIDLREQGRAALREFLKDAPRRPMTEEERLFFAEHKRKREAGEIRAESTEERAQRRARWDAKEEAKRR